MMKGTVFLIYMNTNVAYLKKTNNSKKQTNHRFRCAQYTLMFYK